MIDPDCTEEKCGAVRYCTTCGQRKMPIGRSVPLVMGGAICDSDCKGYREDPYPPHLWPHELAQIREDTASQTQGDPK